MAPSRRRSSPVYELVALSRVLGADERLVQGGGGNTSAKGGDGATLFVKASGVPLKAMTLRRGWRRLDRERVLFVVRDPSVARLPPAARDEAVRRRLLEACADERPGHPSVETPLHAFLGRLVAHVHPAAVNGLLCAREGRQALESLFAAWRPPILYIGWRMPGLPLARATWRAVAAFRRRHGALPNVIFLENHGLFVSGDEVDEVIARVREVDGAVRRLCRARRVAMGAAPRRSRPPAWLPDVLRDVFSAHLAQRPHVGFYCDRPVRALLARADAPPLLAAGALTPDQLAYAHGQPIWLDASADPGAARDALLREIRRRMRRQAGAPRAVLVEDAGLFVVEEAPTLLTMAAAITRASIESLLIAADFGGPRGIPPAAAAYIEGWSYEAFRRKVAVVGTR